MARENSGPTSEGAGCRSEIDDPGGVVDDVETDGDDGVDAPHRHTRGDVLYDLFRGHDGESGGKTGRPPWGGRPALRLPI